MRGGANEFHASLVGLVMRLGADERGQKRMMDVDDLLRVVADEFRGKHLHVARQHDQVNVVLRSSASSCCSASGLLSFVIGMRWYGMW